MATIRKRGKSWQAQIRLADHAPQSKSFSTKAAAEQWARITTHQVLDDHAAPPESRHTLASILEHYRDKIVSLKISKAVETAIINRFFREDFAQTSPLFRSKRAGQLAKILKAKRFINKLDKSKNQYEATQMLFATTEGKSALGFAIGEIRTVGAASRIADLNVCGAIPPYNHLIWGEIGCTVGG